MTQPESCQDMLVKLYDLPLKQNTLSCDLHIRRAKVPEKTQVCEWVKHTFSQGWSDECQSAFSGHPVHCFVAIEKNRPIGFCVYDAIAKGTVGPIGVDKDYRGQGVGRHLLITTLEDMRTQGYAYAILGWVSRKNQVFYEKTVHAQAIEGSDPQTGMYKGLLMPSPPSSSSGHSTS